MNKNNSFGPDFEVSRLGYKRTLRGASCGCVDSRSAHHDTIPGKYSEALSVRGSSGDKCSCETGGCGTQTGSRYGLDNRPVGSVYAPLQDFDCIYDLHRALARGTLFSSLDLPLEVGHGGRCHG